ncbi:hypothetical protein ABEB36_004352 [Hypothenemus hampei]|uniref:Chitin-binding type-2 domain-containing protein n=1 Tax=Hypothenemus hampei TaxID=57062 RepID=A0ABD1F324_HYPHA
MERYHILKLGLAITFYAAYCIRPMLVYCLEGDNDLDNISNNANSQLDFFQYFQGVDGRPGLDFPVYAYIPRTAFSCKGIDSGYYADLETDCQVFHICDEGRKISFLCPNGTIFQQAELICEWWNKVNCSNSPNLYEESAERLQNDLARRKAARRVSSGNHGAIMRMEERSSVRASQNGKDYPINRQKTNGIPQNNDIEQQIEESNNRHLANAQKNQKQTQQQPSYSTHRYNDDNSTRTQKSRSKQTKKDIDNETGNHFNTNYDRSVTRHSKKVEHNGEKEVSNFPIKNNQQKSNTFKEYHVLFGATSDDFPPATENSKTNLKASNNYQIGFNNNAKSQSIETSTLKNNNGDTSKVAVGTTTTVASRKTTKPAYGTTIKERYKSFDARPQQKLLAVNNPRGNVKFGANSNKIPITTYSPPTKFSHEEKYDLPPFPKHKSEQSERDNIPGQIKVNVIQSSNLEESQVPQESSSFVKNSLNSISDDFSKSSPYPNHRSTYSDIKKIPFHLEAPKIPSISSITPHLVTTQPINNGKPFVGSRIGTTVYPNQPTTQSKYTYLPTSTASSKPTIIFGVIRHSSTTESPPIEPPFVDSKKTKEIFNIGNTDKTLPPISSSTQVTNKTPSEIFNVGQTDANLNANVISNIPDTTVLPLNINIPDEGSLNVGQNNDNKQPVNEPPFVKKTIPLLYSQQNSTEKPPVTVYGTYSSSNYRYSVFPKNTPYSPTVPTVTKVSSNKNSVSSTTAKSPKVLGPEIPIRFEKGQDKVKILLSKNIGSSRRPINNIHSRQKVGAVFHVQDVDPLSSTSTEPSYPKSKTERPRPFAKSQPSNEAYTTNNEESHSTIFPSYHISSARPFRISETTTPTSFETTQTTPISNVFDNVDNMIGVLQEIANYNGNEPGLVIPPSVSPQTLHSLAQYFANELQHNTGKEVLEPESKDKLTTLLTSMTVHGYNRLFKSGSETSTGNGTTTGDEVTTISSERDENKDSATTEEIDLLSTTSLPELRELARNFSLALSSYLNDPDNFRKTLESLRPTEPPPLDGNDNVESGTTEDELLNFSDADLKPSTPSAPTATWGYILAPETNKGTQDDVKNSLNPDLNTADSQSFVPRFNNLNVDDNHWTSSPQATKLWQKALVVNPVVVNDEFETTPPNLHLSQELSEDAVSTDVSLETTAPHTEITYDLRELPPISLNSTQVHGILIDFMNHTKYNQSNRLNRILRKLNTSEEEFLNRMKEIESNPLTKRLILLLISECGANVTQELGAAASTHQQNVISDIENGNKKRNSSKVEEQISENHTLRELIHPRLNDEEEDTRALQLLNSLYSIASKFGKKR